MYKNLKICYQIPISAQTPLKLTIKQCQKRLKKEPLNLNLAEASQVKSFAFPVSFC